MWVSRNKFLLKTLGFCYHEDTDSEDFNCMKCGGTWTANYADWFFTTWEGFGKLWKWSREQTWWEDFLIKVNHGTGSIYIHLIDPETFASVIYTYLKTEKDKYGHGAN